jgi:hypothetical protein
MCALSMYVTRVSTTKLNTPPRNQICFAKDALQNGHKDAALSRCTILFRLHTSRTEAVPQPGVQYTAMKLRATTIVHLRQEHAQDFPRLNPTPEHAPQGGTRSQFAAVPGVSQICTVNGDFSRKVTYSPDEPRGWTPRLIIYDHELAYS